MNECKSLGLRQCKSCKYIEDYNKHVYSGKCWIVCCSEVIESLSYREAKLEFISCFNRNKFELYDPDWSYFFGNAFIKMFPEKAHVIENLMVLL